MLPKQCLDARCRGPNPLYYNEASRTSKRQAEAEEKGATLMKLPRETRNMIYETTIVPISCTFSN